MVWTRSWKAAALVVAALGCNSGTKQQAQAQQPPPQPQAQAAAPQTGAGPLATAPPTLRPPDMSQALPSLAPLVQAIKGAVINVDVVSRGNAAMREGMGGGGSEGDDQGDLFQRFFGPGFRHPDIQEQPMREGLGSGIIIDPSGIALTNNHVVQGAVNIRVKLDDGRAFDATVLGRDPLTDVAVIRFKGNPKGLPSVKLGDSDAMKVGDWVVAIGNPFGLASSVSLGIISAKARDIQEGPYDDFLQTDAAINPGNSGGPLFNLKGEVIGINTAIVGGGSGIGFAVPSNIAGALLPQLEKTGTVTRGYLGVQIQDLTPELAKALGVDARRGAIVADVSPGSPGAKAGLKRDDVVVSIDGQPLESAGALSRRVAMQAPGSTATLKVLRGGKAMDVQVKLGKRPDFEGVAAQQEGQGGADERQQKLGLAIEDVNPRMLGGRGPTEGAMIVAVTPGSPAQRAGLAPGMVIVEMNNKPVKSADEAASAFEAAKPGDTVLLRVRSRGGQVLRAITIPEG